MVDEHRKEPTMNRDQLKGKWHQMKGEVKAKWGKLTNDDLDQIDGNLEKLIGRLQERYGYARERAEKEVNDHYVEPADVKY
jgi:uncharacterized protein YjbJ (UPF0337 family)